MLTHLNIKNIAIIDNVSIEFSKGFNVLTGETAAGKSIIIDSINMALGERTSKDLIRHGESKARVEAMFQLDNREIINEIADLGIELEDETLLIQREITSDGKSVCRVNGQLVTAGMLKEISKNLINIHGQHDSQKLLNQASHIEFLDNYANLGELVGSYGAVYSENCELKKRLRQMQTDAAERERMIDMLAYQADEIEQADLRIGEEDELKDRQDYYRNIEKISNAVHSAYERLYSAEPSVYDSMAVAKRSLESVAAYDKRIGEMYQSLEEISSQLEDVVYLLRDYTDEEEYSNADLDKIESRLELIYDLKRKYGNSIESILEFGREAKAQLDELINSEKTEADLSARIAESDKKMQELAGRISEIRSANAAQLETKIMSELADLEMKNVRFKVEISQCEYNKSGADRVEFLIATNQGEPLKPLIKIASGGELSRIMLAIRSVISHADSIETMIFDEIDTGISGRTAFKTAEKIAAISRHKQIICITHLAQIACVANTHFLIKKDVTENKTATNVCLLDFEGRKSELARIIGGAVITDSTLKTAEEMLLQTHI